MPKSGLKDKLDGNELDLSLNHLEVVPVSEIVALKKATHLDLSCNLLKTIPDDFCFRLNYIIHLDLSKNQLQELPLNFGHLVNLKHLDLLHNNLVSLPVSFAQLKSLQWLDLKDNESLDDDLKKVAGDCLSEAQCKQCAKKIVAHMKTVQSEQERRRQEQLRRERELEKNALRLAELEREQKKAQKKAEKERKRQEYEARHRRQKEEELLEEKLSKLDSDDGAAGDYKNEVVVVQEKSEGGVSWCMCLLYFLAFFVTIMIGLIYLNVDEDLIQSKHPVEEKLDILGNRISHQLHAFYSKSAAFLQENFEVVGKKITWFSKNYESALRESYQSASVIIGDFSNRTYVYFEQALTYIKKKLN